jgi:rubrerythrin
MNGENIPVLESESPYTQGFLANPAPIIRDNTPVDKLWVLEQALEIGLTLAEENYRLYLNTLKAANDPGARQLLKELMEEAQSHRREMQAVYEGIIGYHGEPTSFGPVTDLRITDSLWNRPLSPDSTCQDVLIAASKLEKMGYDYFHIQASWAGNEEVRVIWGRFADLKLRRKLRLEEEYDGVVLREN